MFYYDYGISRVRKARQYFQQLFDVVTVQSRSRLVQDIHRAARTAFRKFRRKLHALRFAARQRGRRLPQFDITQAYVLQTFQLVIYPGNVFEKFASGIDRHFQNVVNGFAFVFDFQGFMVIAFAVADVAGNVYVRQKVHFYLDYTVALTGFAPAARNVKAEPPCRIPPGFCVPGPGEQLSDRSKHLYVCCGIRPGRPADRTLIYADDALEVIRAKNFIALPLRLIRTVQLCGKVRIQHSVYQ